MNGNFPFTCLSRDGLVSWAVRSIGRTLIIVFSHRISHSFHPSLGGVLKVMGGMALGVSLVGRDAWFAGLVM